MSGSRLLRLAGRLYPADLRDALWEDMIAVFVRERSRLRSRRGRLAALLYSMRTVAGTVRDALRCRLGAGGRGGVVGGSDPLGLGHDLRHAWAALRSAPAYAGTAVVTLALGIGVAAAMFSVVDHVLLEPLPHPEPERLVRVWRTLPQFDWNRSPVSAPNLADWSARSRTLERVGGYSGAHPVTWLGGEFPLRIAAGYVTAEIWGLAGVHPILGRLPDHVGADPSAPEAVVSARFWQERLGGSRAVIGATIEVDGVRPRVVGVLPEGAGLLPAGVDYWMPAAAHPAGADRGSNFLSAVARLRVGVDGDVAQEEMERIVARLAEEHPDSSAGSGVWIEPHRDFLLGDVRRLIELLAGCAALTLLVVCASLTGLTLTRVYGRGRELAVRAALGATTIRIGRQLLVESAMLGLLGGVFGACVATALLRVFVAYGPDDLPRRSEIALDPTTLALTALVAIGCGLLVGLAPAFRAARLARSGALSGGQTGSVDRIAPGGDRALRLLAAGQVGLATVLLVAAALLGNSFLRLAAVDPGFDPEGRLTAHVALAESRYPDPESAGIFFDSLLERAAALPGVVESGATWALPFRPTYGTSVYEVDGQPAPEGTELLIGLLPVRGDYFASMGVPILDGRGFGLGDGAGSARVAIVNETMAARHWPEGDAVGARFRRGDNEYTIVGVVPDMKRTSLATDPIAEAYLPHRQAAWAGDMYLVLHTEGDPAGLVNGVREILRAMDPQLPATAIAPMEELVASTLAGPRFRTVLVGGFGFFAALLALLGVYGVVRLVVATRTAEIGLRMALGAGRARTAGRILGSGLGLALVGVTIGALAARTFAGAVESLVFGITPTDRTTYLAVSVVLLMVVAFASWLPARRASRIDPVIALRG